MKVRFPSGIALTAICAIAAQIGTEHPKFEVASVKRTERGVIKNSLGPGIVEMKSDPLKIVLMEAFQLKGYQIDGPSWLDEDCFDIVARMPEGAVREQIPAMLQALLAERFELAAHRENRLRPVYALVVGKGGPKFKEADLSFRRTGPRPAQVTFRASAGTRGIKGFLTMATLVRLLANSLDRPALDETGLSGTYDIDVSWAPDVFDRPSAFAEATRERADAVELPAPTATIFQAMQDSLGLKLEARSAPVELLVIDHVRRVPTEN